MDKKKEDLAAELAAQGVQVKWEQHEAKTFTPQIPGTLASLLGQLREALQQRIQGDLDSVERLREAANRMKYGGGQ